MTDSHPRSPAPASPEAGVPATRPRPAPPIRAQWTPAKQRIFLGALLETGSVARAAGAAGMSRSSAHRLRQRLAGTAFDRTWARVIETHAARMADPFGPEALPAQPRPAPAAPVQRP